MLAELSRWLREGPGSRLVPWRWQGPLERATVACAYPSLPMPLRLGATAGPPEAVLLFGGDLALHRWQPDDDPARVFGSLVATLDAADARFFNLESQIVATAPPRGTVGSSLRAGPAALNALAHLGTTVVSCANNHCLDAGSEGLGESTARIEAAGIGVVGVTGPGRDGSMITDVQGIRLGLLAFTDDWRVVNDDAPAFAPLPHQPELVRDRIAALKPAVDVVVVQLHWGYEWSMYPPRSLRDLARDYAARGAALVLCHHAHVPMGLERVGPSVVAHGLGNFYFGPSTGTSHPFARDSFLLKVGIGRTGPVEAEVVPIHTTRDDLVVPSTGRRADRLVRSVACLNRRLELDQYHEDVETSLLVHLGCAIFLDLARRLSAGDSSGVEERIRLLEPERQRLLTARLRELPGIPGSIAALLDQCRGRRDLPGSSLAAEVLALRPAVLACRRAHRLKGRVP